MFVHSQWKLLLCVEVFRPSQPIRVMLSAIILPNHPFSWAGYQYLCTFLRQTWRLSFLNHRKGENDRRKYFTINLRERMLPDPAEIEPATSWSPVGATEPPRPAAAVAERLNSMHKISILVHPTCIMFLAKTYHFVPRLISEQQRVYGRGARAYEADENEKNAAGKVNKDMKNMDKVSHVFRLGDYNNIGRYYTQKNIFK